MKRAFVLSAGRLASALVPMSTKDVLNLGDRIIVSRDLDLGHGAQIKTGERGTIDYISPSTGTVEVLLDTRHRGLDTWDNHMWLEPYGTEDIISGVVLSRHGFERVPKWARVVSATLAASVVLSLWHLAVPAEPFYSIGRTLIVTAVATLPVLMIYV